MLRCMNKNKRKKPIWYSLFQGTEEVTTVKDGFTLYTGDRQSIYTEPVPVRVNVSPADGVTSTSLFGTELNYDKVLVFDRTGPTEIDEYTRLWIDTEPYVNGVLQTHDYEIRRIEKDHNEEIYTVAIARVNRNEQ